MDLEVNVTEAITVSDEFGEARRTPRHRPVHLRAPRTTHVAGTVIYVGITAPIRGP